MIAAYGIWKVGGVVVPLNPMYRGELEHIFSDAEVKGLVVSAVVGIPDEYRGEDVAAFVTLQSGPEADSVSEADIVKFCREKLASYKAPHQVAFIEKLPKTSPGKILRRTFRADAVAAAEDARAEASAAE